LNRKQISLKLNTYQLADKLRGKTSFDHIIGKALRNLKENRKLKEEISKLKQQFQQQESDNVTLEKDLVEKHPCLSRFVHDDIFYCVPRKATAQQLATLKICSRCQWRHTDQLKTVKKRLFLLCNPKEHLDKKKGYMVYCKGYFQGSWVTPEDCKRVNCTQVKEGQIA